MKKLLLLFTTIILFISCSPSTSKIKDLTIKCKSWRDDYFIPYGRFTDKKNTVNLIVENFKITAKNHSEYSSVGSGTEYRFIGTLVYKDGSREKGAKGNIFLADSGEIANCNETWK